MEEVLRTGVKSLVKVGEALGLKNLDPESGRILVTNALHDVVGYRVVQRLIRAGYPQVRIAGVTASELGGHGDSAQTDEVLVQWNSHEHVEVVNNFDWDLEDTYEAALKDVKSVLICLPYREPSWYMDCFPKFIRACGRAGVRHVVKLSFWHDPVGPCPLAGPAFEAPTAGILSGILDEYKHPPAVAKKSEDLPDKSAISAYHEVPFVHAMLECDKWLLAHVTPHKEMFNMKDVNVGSYTILSSGHLMSDPLVAQGKELRRADKPAPYYGASQNQLVNYVSPNDVAEVAVRVLLEPRAHYNCEYTLTNSQHNSLTEQDVASLLSKYLEKPIMYVNQPLHEYESELRMSGTLDFAVKDTLAFEKIKATGVEGRVGLATDHVEHLCGHSPQSFEDYLMNTEDMLPIEKS